MNFKKDVVLVTVAHGNPALLEHQLNAYEEFGKPNEHIIWVNDPNLLDIAQRAKNCKVIHTTNLGLLAPFDILSEFITKRYFFIMPNDFRVTKSTWMEQYELCMPAHIVGIPGTDSFSVDGELHAEPNKLPKHIRLGGILIDRKAFLHIGKFGIMQGSQYGARSEQYEKHINCEVAFTSRFIDAGYRVRVIEKPPIYDYEHWGRNKQDKIWLGTLEELREFDRVHGVEPQSTTF